MKNETSSRDLTEESKKALSVGYSRFVLFMWVCAVCGAILVFLAKSLATQIGFATIVFLLLMSSAYLGFPYYKIYVKYAAHFEDEERSSFCANLSILGSCIPLAFVHIAMPLLDDNGWNLVPSLLITFVFGVSYILAVVFILLSIASREKPIWLPPLSLLALACSIRLTIGPGL